LPMFPNLQADQQARIVHEMLRFLRIEMIPKQTDLQLEIGNRIA
jgi:hypothetical protein